MPPLRLLPLVGLAAFVPLAACGGGVQAPSDIGVCYHLAALAGGQPRYNVVGRNVPDMEHCAGELEAMRIRFLSLGGSNRDIVGAYQGNFLFLGDEGVFTSQSYTGTRYPFMARQGNQLVPVG